MRPVVKNCFRIPMIFQCRFCPSCCRLLSALSSGRSMRKPTNERRITDVAVRGDTFSSASRAKPMAPWRCMRKLTSTRRMALCNVLDDACEWHKARPALRQLLCRNEVCQRQRLVLVGLYRPMSRDGKILFFYKKMGFKVLAFLGFNLQMLDTKFTTHKKRFGHVNATNRNSYMNTICIKFVTQVEKN